MCASNKCSRPGSCVSAIGSSGLPWKLSASPGPTQPRVWLGCLGAALHCCPPLPEHADTLRHSEGWDINATPGASEVRVWQTAAVSKRGGRGMWSRTPHVIGRSAVSVPPPDGRLPGPALCRFIHSSCRGAPAGTAGPLLP